MIKGVLRKAFDAIVGQKKPSGSELEPDHVVYAIGDVHGYSDALDTLLRDIKADIADRRKTKPHMTAEMVFLGDYVSRGPDSKGVLNILAQELESQGGDRIKRTFLAGNHDYLLYKMLTLEDPMNAVELAKSLLENGDLNTAASYGVFLQNEIAESGQQIRLRGAGLVVTLQSLDGYVRQMKAVIPNEHINVLKRMKISYHTPDAPEFFFCHAGVDWTKPYDSQEKYVLLGIGNQHQQQISRQFALQTKGARDIIVVHGHTPRSGVEFERNPSSDIGGRISTDTGIFTKDGKLSCGVLGNGCLLDVIQTKTQDLPYDRKKIPIAQDYESRAPTNSSYPLDAAPK
ncbi:MAG: metallophosphoesterase [Alphaproteobacteria bacterium]|nr:metallophosphoesterase [Alphaproteobacteria bacterium]MCB9984742.1 metallophosphoesterase [Micavibrio sp.]